MSSCANILDFPVPIWVQSELPSVAASLSCHCALHLQKARAWLFFPNGTLFLATNSLVSQQESRKLVSVTSFFPENCP